MGRRYKGIIKQPLSFGADGNGKNFHCNQKIPRKLKKQFKKLLAKL